LVLVKYGSMRLCYKRPAAPSFDLWHLRKVNDAASDCTNN
jgi:hypothetical protein